MSVTRRSWRDIVIITAVALAMRIAFQFALTPLWAGDSPGYAAAWRISRTYEWQYYDGFRPPGYPALLGLAQWLTGSKAEVRLTSAAAAAAVLLHQVGGITASVLLYLTLLNVGVARRLAFCGALLYALLVAVAQFEMYVLPLAPTSSLLVAALWLFSLAVRRATTGKRSRWFASASGLVFAWATLTRTEVVLVFATVVAVTVLAGCIYHTRPELKPLSGVGWQAAAVGVPPLLLWMGFNYLMLGQFTFTTLRPYNLTCTVYNIFDRVEKKDRVFGRIMLKYYRGPARIDLINDAFEELLQHAHEMPLRRRGPWTLRADMCVYAGKVAKRLQRHYPDVYLANAWESFRRTFHFPHGAGIPRVHVSDPESPDGKHVIKSKSVFDFTDALRRPDPLIMSLLYCLTILYVPVSLLRVLVKRASPTPEVLIVCAVALSTVGTFLAYGFVHVYFYHYGMVFFGPIVICGTAACDWLFKQRKTSSPSG